MAADGQAEIQGDHLANVTKFLLSRDDRLIQVAGCGKKAKEREEKKRAKEEEEARAAAAAASVQASAAARRGEEGKARWSSAKKEAVVSRNANPQEPEGWRDDPRRCPFGWLYCSGVCMGLTPAEFKATKQHVWAEESDFFYKAGGAAATGTRTRAISEQSLGIAADFPSHVSLDAALQALGMLASGAGGPGWRKEQEKRKKSKAPAPPAAGRASVTPVATFVPPKLESTSEWERASRLQAAADAFALAQISSSKPPSAGHSSSLQGSRSASRGGTSSSWAQGRPATGGGRRGGRGGRAGTGFSSGHGGGGSGSGWKMRASDDWESDGEGGWDDEYEVEYDSPEDSAHQGQPYTRGALELSELLSEQSRTGGAGSRRRSAHEYAEADEVADEEEAIMEAIARSLQEEAAAASRRGGGGVAGSRGLWGGEDASEKSPEEVAAVVADRGWLRAWAPTVCSSVRACVHACSHACVRAHVLACVRCRWCVLLCLLACLPACLPASVRVCELEYASRL